MEVQIDLEDYIASKRYFITVREGPVMHIFDNGNEVATIKLTHNEAVVLCSGLFVKCQDYRWCRKETLAQHGVNKLAKVFLWW